MVCCDVVLCDHLVWSSVLELIHNGAELKLLWKKKNPRHPSKVSSGDRALTDAERLENLAENIGKLGLFAAALTLVALIARVCVGKSNLNTNSGLLKTTSFTTRHGSGTRLEFSLDSSSLLSLSLLWLFLKVFHSL